jgi:hypothetical protein
VRVSFCLDFVLLIGVERQERHVAGFLVLLQTMKQGCLVCILDSCVFYNLQYYIA